MHVGRGSWLWLGGAITVLAVVYCSSGAGQQAPTRTPRLDPGAASAPVDPGDVARDEERMKMVNDERRREIPSETAKLVVVAREFKAMVDASSTEQAPPGAVKKAAEIEKLARDVKNRMQN
jgi:hypothetical protein